MYKNTFRKKYLLVDVFMFNLKNFYLFNFSFSNKENKLFFNIIVNTFICNYQLIHEEFIRINNF